MPVLPILSRTRRPMLQYYASCVILALQPTVSCLVWAQELLRMGRPDVGGAEFMVADQ